MVLLDLPILRKLPLATDIGFPRHRVTIGGGRLGREPHQPCGFLPDEVAPLGCLRQVQATGRELLEGRSCPPFGVSDHCVALGQRRHHPGRQLLLLLDQVRSLLPQPGNPFRRTPARLLPNLIDRHR